MLRKMVDGALWGLGFWLVAGVLIFVFSSFEKHVEAKQQAAVMSAQQRPIDQQFARSENLLDRQEKSMAEAERQTARLDKLMDKWESRK